MVTVDASTRIRHDQYGRLTSAMATFACLPLPA